MESGTCSPKILPCVNSSAFMQLLPDDKKAKILVIRITANFLSFTGVPPSYAMHQYKLFE